MKKQLTIEEKRLVLQLARIKRGAGDQIKFIRNPDAKVRLFKEFWQTLHFLIETGVLEVNNDYKIITPKTLKVYIPKNRSDEYWENKYGEPILCLLFAEVYEKYKQYCIEEKKEILSEHILKSLFRGSSYYIGRSRRLYFPPNRCGGYAFRHDELKSIENIRIV